MWGPEEGQRERGRKKYLKNQDSLQFWSPFHHSSLDLRVWGEEDQRVLGMWWELLQASALSCPSRRRNCTYHVLGAMSALISVHWPAWVCERFYSHSLKRQKRLREIRQLPRSWNQDWNLVPSSSCLSWYPLMPSAHTLISCGLTGVTPGREQCWAGVWSPGGTDWKQRAQRHPGAYRTLSSFHREEDFLREPCPLSRDLIHQPGTGTGLKLIPGNLRIPNSSSQTYPQGQAEQSLSCTWSESQAWPCLYRVTGTPQILHSQLHSHFHSPSKPSWKVDAR